MLTKAGFSFISLTLYFTDAPSLDDVLYGNVGTISRLAKSSIFIVEGKRFNEKVLSDFMPEAISQAAALCEVTGSESPLLLLSGS